MYKIIAKQTCVEVHGYDLGDKPDLERIFCIYDEIYHKLVPKGFDYNEEERILYLPRGMDIGYLERILNTPIEMDRGYNNYSKAVYKLTTEPRDENQVKSIAYLIGEGEFKYTSRYSQQSLNLDVTFTPASIFLSKYKILASATGVCSGSSDFSYLCEASVIRPIVLDAFLIVA